MSTAGLQAAHHYIWDFIQQLQAAGERRGDILVQTAFENYTGSNDFDFVVRDTLQLPQLMEPQALGQQLRSKGCYICFNPDADKPNISCGTG